MRDRTYPGRVPADPADRADLHVWTLGLRTRFRGLTVRDGVLLRGDAGWGEFSPFWDYDAAESAAWWRAAREAADEGWPDPVRDARPGQRHGPRGRRRERRTGSSRLGRLPDRQGQGRRARPDASPTRSPASRRSATRSARAARSASTPTPPGTSTPPSARLARARPGGRRARVRRAARRRGRRPRRAPPAHARAARGRRVDPPRAGPAGRRARARPPTSSCSRSSRSAGSARASSSPSGSACRSSSPRRSRRPSASPPASRSPPRCPTCPYACGLATAQLLAADVVDRPAAARRRRDRGAPTRAGPGACSPRPPRPRTLADALAPRASDAVRARARWRARRRRPPLTTPRPGDDRGPRARAGARGPRRARTSCWPPARAARRWPTRSPTPPARRRAPGRRPGAAPARAGRRARRRRSSRSGLARAARRRDGRRRAPVAVVTTSGTAVANLHPAVLEAHHAGLPLAAAHRRPPARAARHRRQPDHRPGRASSAAAVRLAVDVPAPVGRPGEDRDLRRARSRARSPPRLGARTGDPGPVHLDLAFREPLVPGRRALAGRRPTAGLAARAAPADARPARSGRRSPAPTALPAPPRADAASRPSWSPATAPVPPRGGSPRRTGGRCWPSRRPARAAGRTRSPPTGCCSAHARLGGRGAPRRRARAPHAVPPGAAAARARRTSRSSSSRPRGADWPDAARNATDVLLEVARPDAPGPDARAGRLARRVARGGRGGAARRSTACSTASTRAAGRAAAPG